jgi:hypothetical protein
MLRFDDLARSGRCGVSYSIMRPGKLYLITAESASAAVAASDLHKSCISSQQCPACILGLRIY